MCYPTPPTLTPGLRNLLCGLGLPEVLELQGKATMRESLMATLERLRLASKADVIPILPVLLAQTNELLTVKVSVSPTHTRTEVRP